MFVLLLFSVFKLQYEGRAEGKVYEYAHSFAVMYIIGVYIVSVFENLRRLLGTSEFYGMIKFAKLRMIKQKDNKDGKG